jgi:hypothetical protein
MTNLVFVTYQHVQTSTFNLMGSFFIVRLGTVIAPVLDLDL